MAEDVVDREELLPLLRGPLKKSGEWLLSFCPAHSDGVRHKGTDGQSLGLSDRGVLVCYAGCDFKAIMEGLRGGSGNGPEPTPIRNDNAPTLRSVYQYRRADGALVAEKGRFETMGGSKTFRWRIPGAEAWSGLEGIKADELPLYGSDLLADRPDEPVYFIEGEKATEACWERGLLAVTAGGGAGQKTFGTALQVLKGREVRLWPDNDAPGRQHMVLLEALVSPLADKVLWVQVEQGEKEDAADYFRKGGKLAELKVVNPRDVMMTVLGDEAVQVIVPTPQGPVTMTFEEMEKTGRGLDTFLTVRTKESGDYPLQQQINLSSASGVTELRRTLDAMYGKDYGWAGVWNKAENLARAWFLGQDRSQDVADIPEPIGDVLLIPPFVVADGPTMVFGDGSSLKSYWSFILAACCSLEVTFCGFPVPYLRPMIIDYEDSPRNFRRRMSRAFAGIGFPNVDPGLVRYWEAKGIPVVDQVEAIKKTCDKHGIGLLIVDSAAPACGSDVLDSRAVLAFFRALKKIGLPVIIIAHVTKNGDATDKPFGSVFWHNESRRTWYVERVQDEDSDELDVGLFCRKVNDGVRPTPLAFKVRFDGKAGPVTMELSNLESVAQLVDRTSPQNQVWLALRERPQTVTWVSESTGLDRKVIERTLARGPFERAGMYQPPGAGKPAQLWARKSEREPEQGRAMGDHWDH